MTFRGDVWVGSLAMVPFQATATTRIDAVGSPRLSHPPHDNLLDHKEAVARRTVLHDKCTTVFALIKYSDDTSLTVSWPWK
eukprot:scaffold4884_cov165-Amphora_coffeaeformis.AAC.4